MQTLESQLDEAAAALILVDPTDMPALAALHDKFEALTAALSTECPELAAVSSQCAEITKQLILREVDDTESAIESLGQAIAALQGVVRDHRRIDEVTFPPGFYAPAPPTPVRPKAAKPAEAEAPSPPTPAQPTATVGNTEERPLTMEFAGADSSLVGEFINEARDHCLTAEQKMMDLETGADYEAGVNAIFRSFHSIKGAAGFLALHPISALAHDSETLLDMLRKGTLTLNPCLVDVVFAAVDGLRTLLDQAEEGLRTGGTVDGSELVSALANRLQAIIAAPADQTESDASPRVGDILIELGATTQPVIDSALERRQSPQERIGETLVRQGVVPAKVVDHALRHQRLARQAGDAVAASAGVKEMVKIDTERLDRLVDTIGELVIAESMVGHDDEFLAIAPPRTAKSISHLNKITRELQDMGMAMRLVPVKGVFQKLARAVRDLSRKSGKTIELETSGDDVEVDRSIAEQIGDPLMHMIRNAVDHAIETAEERIAAGKSAAGRVWLRAFHRGGSIHFEIEDDGRGLDTERILAKAREKGLLDAGRELSQREVFNLILLPGFSTAKEVTDISGRGVGMDVVKKNIELMRGHLDIDSAPGRGTRFTMKVPLTLAMIDGMLIRVANEPYIIPTMSVVEFVNWSSEQVTTILNDQEIISLRGNLLPVVRLGELFGLPQYDPADDRIVVVVEDGDKRVGLAAEALIGQRQTVIKSLGPLFQRKKWLSGGAILSDGSVGLILDVGGLVELSRAGTASAAAPTGADEGIDRVNDQYTVNRHRPRRTDSRRRRPEPVLA